MSHQDWETIVITKPKTGANGKLGASQKNPRSNITNQQKALLNDEFPTIKYVDREFSKELVAARVAKGLTRKQVAHQLCMQESVIATFENGTAIHSGPIISKFKTFFGMNKKV
jgi:ribosome-binding protein aMBF1 (putative translation factor)